MFIMNPIQIKDITIGKDSPKICVPVVGRMKEEILLNFQNLQNAPADLIEWRADHFDGVFCLEEVLTLLKEISGKYGKWPLLFTFRTLEEGGEKPIDLNYYKQLNQAVAQSGYVDLIDVEVFRDKKVVEEIIEEALRGGVYVVGSNHEFSYTPSKEEIVKRLCTMQDLGVSIPKIAVMPQNKKDVLTLLEATEEMVQKYADRPVITMSMQVTGLISRLCGEVFGSAVTFGAVGQVSAPGQINAEELKVVLNIMHQALKGSQL